MPALCAFVCRLPTSLRSFAVGLGRVLFRPLPASCSRASHKQKSPELRLDDAVVLLLFLRMMVAARAQLLAVVVVENNNESPVASSYSTITRTTNVLYRSLPLSDGVYVCV